MARKNQSKALVKSEPSKMLSPFEETEKWFEEAFRRPLSMLSPSWWPRFRGTELEDITPSVDIFEDADNVVVKAELPGMNKEDIDVTLNDDIITISGEKKKEEKVEKKNYFRLERSHGSFRRSFRLPAEVQTDKAKANFKNGVLELKIPKTAEAKKKEKKVKIE